MELRTWWEDLDRTWVTQYSTTTRSQLDGEYVVPGYFPTTRNLANLARNTALALQVIRASEPDIIVSSGAGIAFPFIALGRALGIPTVFIEVFDRVDSRTLTGTLCHPWTNLFVVQWPEQQARYVGSHLVGALWAGSSAPRRPPESTARPLVLTTVGTDHHPFDRLMGWIDRYEAPEDVRLFCQHGTAPPPSSGESSPWLSHDELQGLIADASAVVLHGGPYSILECLRHGLHPIVVPREQRYGEAVDDHQLAFTSMLAAEGKISCVRTEAELHAALDTALTRSRSAPPLTEDETATSTSVERFCQLVDQLTRSGRG